MEKKLQSMFDYQRFNGNKKLESMLMAAENRYPAMLTDEDLDMVSAAGIQSASAYTKKEKPVEKK